MRHAALVLICAIVCAASLSAQGLSDLARKEEQRRKSVTPGKVYTNDNLKPAPSPSAPATPPAPAPSQDQAAAPAQPGTPPPAPEPQKPETQKKDEAYWRGRLQAERDGIERAKVLLDALQGRVNGLQTDFVNRDDPAARAMVSAERQRVLAELDRTKLEIQQRTKAIAEIQEEARRSGVPAAWYR